VVGAVTTNTCGKCPADWHRRSSQYDTVAATRMFFFPLAALHELVPEASQSGQKIPTDQMMDQLIDARGPRNRAKTSHLSPQGLLYLFHSFAGQNLIFEPVVANSLISRPGGSHVFRDLALYARVTRQSRVFHPWVWLHPV
jgi:hypothetical protein